MHIAIVTQAISYCRTGLAGCVTGLREAGFESCAVVSNLGQVRLLYNYSGSLSCVNMVVDTCVRTVFTH